MQPLLKKTYKMLIHTKHFSFSDRKTNVKYPKFNNPMLFSEYLQITWNHNTFQQTID